MRRRNVHHNPLFQSLIFHHLFAVFSLNDIVIKCYNGMASSVCVAVDAVISDRMLGTIAGDDTIFIIARSPEDAAALADELKTFF